MRTRSVPRKSSTSIKKSQKQKKTGSKKMDFRELLLLQSIICAVLLFLGLVLNNNSAFATNLITNIQVSISDNSLMQNTRFSISELLENSNSEYHSENDNLRIDEEVLYEINRRNDLRNIVHNEKK